MDSEVLQTAFRLQAGACRHWGSELYARILAAAERDVRDAGPIADLCREFEGDPLRGFLPLRIMGAVHARVLGGGAPDLARHYPSVGGHPEHPGAWDAFRDVVRTQAESLRPALANFPQTNEVRRCSGLVSALLVVAARTGLPIRVREIGASAGLNLLFDRYRYELGPHRFGDAKSSVCVQSEWEGPPAPFEAALSVESRAGCDIAPVDLGDPEQVTTLQSYIWADQTERIDMQRAAIEQARRDPPRLDRARAGDWLSSEIEEAPDGVARVVFHSSVWLYIPTEEQFRIERLMAGAGERATGRSPLAWLRQEDVFGQGRIDIHLRVWPPGEDFHLGTAHPHGIRVRWQGDVGLVV